MNIKISIIMSENDDNNFLNLYLLNTGLNMNSTKELQDSLQEVSVVMRELKQKIPSNKKFIKTLLHIFCGVTDFRQPAKIKYRLENIL